MPFKTTRVLQLALLAGTATCTATVFSLKPESAAETLMERLQAKAVIEEKVLINGNPGTFAAAATALSFGDALRTLGGDLRAGTLLTGSQAILAEMATAAGQHDRVYVLSPSPQAQTLVFRMRYSDTSNSGKAAWPDRVPQPERGSPGLAIEFPSRDTFYATWDTDESTGVLGERYAQRLAAAGWQPAAAGRPDAGLFTHGKGRLLLQFYACGRDEGSTLAAVFVTATK